MISTLIAILDLKAFASKSFRNIGLRGVVIGEATKELWSDTKCQLSTPRKANIGRR
jgi:hypothetical protein